MFIYTASSAIHVLDHGYLERPAIFHVVLPTWRINMNGLSELTCAIIIVLFGSGCVVGWFSHKWYGHIPLDGTNEEKSRE